MPTSPVSKSPLPMKDKQHPTYSEKILAASRTDPHRPHYHFLPPGGWMNDPNGLIYLNGVWHLFYQYNPKEPVWGPPDWGHAISHDLVTWQHKPIALTPEMAPQDLDGCWSGCAVLDEHQVLTLLYTGVQEGVQRTCIATAVGEDHTVFEKLASNPVMDFPNKTQLDISYGAFRDPFVWCERQPITEPVASSNTPPETEDRPALQDQEENPQSPVDPASEADAEKLAHEEDVQDKGVTAEVAEVKDEVIWYCVLGTSVGNSGQALLYRSPDLRTWELIGPLVPEGAREFLRPQKTGFIWECPNFFALGEQYGLVVSAWQHDILNYPVLFLGRYRDHQFVPSKTQRLDWGHRCYYAPLSTEDDTGRRLVWGWLQEQRTERVCREAGWAGVMSLPRVIRSEGEGEFSQHFAPELKQLRAEEVSVEAIKSRSFELIASAAHDQNTHISLRSSHAHHITITFDWQAGTLQVKKRDAYNYNSYILPLQVRNDAKLHMYMDQSVVEMILNDREALSFRYYPDYTKKITLELTGATTASAWLLKEMPITGSVLRPIASLKSN